MDDIVDEMETEGADSSPNKDQSVGEEGARVDFSSQIRFSSPLDLNILEPGLQSASPMIFDAIEDSSCKKDPNPWFALTVAAPLKLSASPVQVNHQKMQIERRASLESRQGAQNEE